MNEKVKEDPTSLHSATTHWSQITFSMGGIVKMKFPFGQWAIISRAIDDPL